MSKKIIILISLLTLFALPLFVHAAGSFDYTPLENIPGSNLTGPTNFYTYVQAIYKFGIWAVGIVAMFMIIWGGYTYITSAGNNSTMETAKKIITDAIVGLILALTSYLILYIINPDLVRINALPSATGTPAAPGTAPSAPPATPSSTITSCSSIPSQVPAQCSAASPDLVNLISCVYQKTNGKVQVSSISDGNGGLKCYQDHPSWKQCPSSGGGTNCCYHAKTSCHYGGKCSDGSHAVDFSYKGSAADLSTMQSAVISCGGKANPEGNHLHASIGNCCAL